jgi:hypothetical protein
LFRHYILLDWAQHTDEKQVKDALYALLRECELEGDAGYLKKVLSNFFLALTDPWKTRASAIFAAQPAKRWKLAHRATPFGGPEEYENDQET